MTATHSTFRTDIEGLRALAIVPILLFHLDPTLCPSGFIGVDIFFVISGYLITQMIVAQGRDFRFGAFYYRRIFRLYPALLVTVSATLTAGWFILSPADYEAAGLSGLFSLVGLSNFYFLSTVDYFNNTALVHPLLHTWSLGVEEQFYLIWPLVLVLLVLSGRISVLTLSLVAGGASFALATLAITRYPDAAFYMVPFRVFEFAAGAAAWAVKDRFDRDGNATLAVGAVGAMGLGIALWSIDKQTAWPGVWTLLPVAATAMLLIGGIHPTLSAVLSNPLFRFLGRTSYSLYLVHWPVIVLYSYWAIVPPTPLELVALGVACIALGALLHVGVEQPFRMQGAADRRAQPGHSIVGSARVRLPIAALAKVRMPLVAGLTCTTVASGVTISAWNGFPSRLDRGSVQVFDKGLTYAGDLCSYKRSRCVFGDKAAELVVYLVGDSHALNLVYGLDDLFKARGIKGIAFYDHGCLFLKDTLIFPGGVLDARCKGNVEDAFAQLARDRHPLIFSGNYQSYRGQEADAGMSGAKKHSEDDYVRWFDERLEASLRSIGGEERRVVLVKQMYSTGLHLHRCLTSPAAQAGSARCVVDTLEEAQAKTEASDAMIAAVADRFANVATVDPKFVFCATEPCRTMDEGGIYFRDSDHLTNNGSLFLVRALADDLLEAVGWSDNRRFRVQAGAGEAASAGEEASSR